LIRLSGKKTVSRGLSEISIRGVGSGGSGRTSFPLPAPRREQATASEDQVR
jgi:hypothetical protein